MLKSIVTTSFRVLIVLCLFAALNGAVNVSANDENSARIIVQLDANEQIVEDITFSGSITGLEALQLTGLDIVTADMGWGVSVCSIEGVGCPADDCFCGGNNFWNYLYQDANGWQSSPSGASTRTIVDDAVEGWRWGSWGVVALPSAEAMSAANDALDWLQLQQSEEDGGYVSMGSSSETLLSIGAARSPASDWRRTATSPSLLSYTMLHGKAYANDNAGASGKIAIGLAGSAGCWPYGANQPLDYYDSATGLFDASSYNQALAILGALSLNQSVPPEAVTALKTQVNANGGWEFSAGWGTDTNTTALVIQALIASGEQTSSAIIVDGLQYLKTNQQNDGGFPYNLDDTWGPVSSDADSTAFVIQAIVAAGQDPESPAWTVNESTPVEFLLSVQLADGSLGWQDDSASNTLATQQSIPALLYQPAPFVTTGINDCSSVFIPEIGLGD